MLRTDLLKWASKQSKQVPAGLPVVAVLTCMEQESQMIQSIDSFVDQLHKQIKVRRLACMLAFASRAAGAGAVTCVCIDPGPLTAPHARPALPLLQDKKNASMAMLCLCRCVWCFLRRMGGRGGPTQLRVWVDRSVSPAVQAMVKGVLPAPEQQVNRCGTCRGQLVGCSPGPGNDLSTLPRCL